MAKQRHFWADWRCPHCRGRVRVYRCFSRREMYTLFCASCRLRVFYFNADRVGLRGLEFRRTEYR